MLIQQSEIMSSTNFNCWRSSIHQSPEYSNRGKCNFVTSHKKRFFMLSLGYLAHLYFLTIGQRQLGLFLEQALLEIGHRQTLVTVSSIFNDLANACGSTC